MQGKPIEIQGATAAVNRPLRLRRYDVQNLPDPGACVDSLIAVNDRTQPGSVKLHFSDGSTWLPCSGVTVQSVAPQTVDVTPLVVQAVREQLPALLPVRQIAVPQLAAPDSNPADLKVIAEAHLRMAEIVNDLQRRLAEAEARIDQLDRGMKEIDRVEVVTHARGLR